MCMIFVPICVLPLHCNHRLGGIDHVHINDLAAALLSISISTQNSKLQTNSSSSPRTFMSLPHTTICESLVGNIRSSSGNDEFIMASSPMYVVPFINEINYNETREFSTQHLGVRRSPPSRRRFWIPWKWSSTSQVTPTPPTRRMRVWGATHLNKYMLVKIKLDDFPVGRGWK